MLPEFLSNSYKQYKYDTSVFITWLGHAAKSCGYISKAKEVPTTVLDGNIKPMKHAVSTRELVAQVSTVSSSNAGIRIPENIKTYLKRAIDARQRCSDWYENTEHKTGVHDGGGHRHFIKVLQDALAKLGGLEEDRGTTPKSDVKRLSPKDKEIVQLENRLSHLNIEGVDESHHLSPTKIALVTGNIEQDIPKSVDVVELEGERAFENAFSVFCFFEDLHRIQGKLKETWEACNSRKINLMTATAVTEAVICMISHTERDLCSTLFPDNPADNCYETFASMMVLVESITKGTNPTEDTRVDVTPFDSFTFLPAARTLIKFIHMGSLSSGIAKKWPAPILPLRFNYLQDLHKLDTSEHKKLQHDDEILSQLLLDLQLTDSGKGKKKYTKEMEDIWMSQCLAQDIFLRTLQPAWTEGKLSLTTVVTSQIWLDMIDTCSDLPKFSKQLTYANAYISKSTNFTTTPDGKLGPACGNLKWPKLGEKAQIKMPVFPLMKNFMLQIRQTPRLYTWENTAPELRERMSVDERPPPEVQAAFQQINLDLIKPAPADDFVITHNPLYSGTILLKLLLAHQEAGLVLANDHLSIFAVAHIYNALRQLKMIDQEWQLMERSRKRLLR
ncbi:hypothetical protein M434DRAFT_16208 [Hypoxylon sp. CO27-5]|nr:hypothetical protein M434DRAFT_16208 [Hypoxylon sp. CO27-5]